MDIVSGWCRSKRDLHGVTAIVTGCNTGIGKETVRDIYNRGARVIMACRNRVKAEEAKKDIEDSMTSKDTKGVLIVEELDLSSLKSVKKFVQKVLKDEENIHILVNNAGVMMCPESRTEDGFETQIGTNHFGHAMLTLLLLPKLKNSGPSRVVFVSSLLHKDFAMDLEDINSEKTPYSALKAYGRSKAANVMFSNALAQKLKEHNISNVSTYSLHPGVIKTDIGRHFSDTAWYGATWAFNNILGWFVKSARCGAQTSIYCAIDEKCENESGLYYQDCKVTTPAKECQDQGRNSVLWTKTIEALKLGKYDPFGDSDPTDVINAWALLRENTKKPLGATSRAKKHGRSAVSSYKHFKVIYERSVGCTNVNFCLFNCY